MAKPTTVESLERTPMFSQDDIKWFKRSLEKLKVSGRARYGDCLTAYEMFLISVAAVNWYPDKKRITVASYHDNDIDGYLNRYVSENHPMAGNTFVELTRPMTTDENKRKHRWIRDRFVPRAFWDELYQALK